MREFYKYLAIYEHNKEKEKLDVDGESSQRDNGFLRCERTYENK